MANAAYKKQDGRLTVTDEHVLWTPKSEATATVKLAVSKLTNLQQTPDTAAKVMLKIFEKAGDGDPVTYLFHFNSSTNPRMEANAIKDQLSRLMAESRRNDPGIPQPTSANGGSASAGEPAATRPSVSLFDDSALKSNIALQQSLMKANRNLHQMYMEGRATKPDSMSDATYNVQFWSARINQLRSHAIETAQKKGPYNVLAQVKPEIEQNPDPNQPSRMKLNITVEQVQMIFNQHPLVKRIYNENVPPLTEGQFWERFFLSKLSKKLKGEFATGSENPDKIFDKYDEYENITAFSSKLLEAHVPHIIDVEGNEENQGGFKGGNRKDQEMRPRGRADAPIVQTLNSLSGKLLVNVAAADDELNNSTGVDKGTFSQLALRDLRGDAEQQRIILNIKEQNSFFANQNDYNTNGADEFAKQDPVQVLKDMQSDLGSLRSRGAEGVDLHTAIGLGDDSDSEDEEDDTDQNTGERKKPHVGSRAARRSAQKQIVDNLVQRRSQLYGGDTTEETSPMGLPADIAAKCSLTHATTIEFLHQFWSTFVSGDPDRAAELGYLVESLRRSKERIRAVAAEADKARDEEIRKRKQEIYEHFERTGKKIRFKAAAIRGGRSAVETLMASVVQALDRALGEYGRALEAEGIKLSTES